MDQEKGTLLLSLRAWVLACQTLFFRWIGAKNELSFNPKQTIG